MLCNSLTLVFLEAMKLNVNTMPSFLNTPFAFQRRPWVRKQTAIESYVAFVSFILKPV